MSPDPRSAALLAQIGNETEGLDRGQHGPAREVTMLRDHGWLTAPLPVDHGGHDWAHGTAGARDGFAALFMLGSVSLPLTRIFEGHVNAIRLIDRHGSADQRTQLFGAVRDGALLAIWGADGDRPAQITSTGPAARLHGTKTFSSGLGVVAQAIVTATDPAGGCQMVIVAANEAARWHLPAWDVAAMVGTCSGEFVLDGLPATANWLLGPPGALFVEPDFNGGVWRLCAGYAGAMAAIAQQTQAQVQQRNVSDDPRMSARLGHIQHRAQTALLWAWHACRAVESASNDQPRDIDDVQRHTERRAERAMATTLFAREAIEQAACAQLDLVERIGGTGLHRRRSALGRQIRDLRFFLRQAGLDAKLDAAVSMYPGDPRRVLAEVIDGYGDADDRRAITGGMIADDREQVRQQAQIISMLETIQC